MTEPDALDHFLARLTVMVIDDPMPVIDEWAAKFTDMRTAGRYADCRRLLLTAKGWTLLDHARGIVLYAEGWLADRLGDTDEAIAAYERARGAFAAAGIDLESTFWMQLGALYQDAGDHKAAIRDFERASAIALDSGDDHQRARVLHNLGSLWIVLGDEDAADELLEEATALFEEYDDTLNRGAARLSLGHIRASRGQLAEAQSLFRDAASDFESEGEPVSRASALASLGVLELRHGSADTAAQLLELSLVTFMKAGDTKNAARTLNNLADVETRRQQFEAAAKYRSQAEELYEILGELERNA